MSAEVVVDGYFGNGDFWLRFSGVLLDWLFGGLLPARAEAFKLLLVELFKLFVVGLDYDVSIIIVIVIAGSALCSADLCI